MPEAGWGAAVPDVRRVIRRPGDLVPGWETCVPWDQRPLQALGRGLSHSWLLSFAARSRDFFTPLCRDSLVSALEITLADGPKNNGD